MTMSLLNRVDAPRDPRRHAGAILVFGAGIWPTGPSPAMRVRAARAAELYAEGRAPTILCSGGRSRGTSEAGVLCALLVEAGVPDDAIIVDDGGTSTRAAIRSARGFAAGRWERVIAVSSPYHMRRIGLEARRQGLDVILCPAHLDGPRTLRQRAFWLRQQVRESVAVPLYAATDRLDGAFERITGRSVRAAVASVAARARWLAGDADAVVDASDVITDRIKESSPETSEAVAVLTPAAAGLAWPVPRDVTSAFGLRHRRLHSGIDIRAGYGTPITAAAGGRVLLAGWLWPYGNVTVIDHGGGLSTVYAHQAGLMLPEREAVAGGQVIGFAGSTGRSSGPHLHFEVRVHGTPVDPLAYLS